MYFASPWFCSNVWAASFLSSTICLTPGFLSHIMFSAPVKGYNQLSKQFPQCMHIVRDVNVQNGKAIFRRLFSFSSFFCLFVAFSISLSGFLSCWIQKNEMSRDWRSFNSGHLTIDYDTKMLISFTCFTRSIRSSVVRKDCNNSQKLALYLCASVRGVMCGRWVREWET